MSDQDVPQAVHAEVDVLLARAAAHRRPLRTIPRLEVDTRRRPRNHYYPARRGRPPVVQVTPQLLATAPQERAWSLAHELGHALRDQEGTGARTSAVRRLLTVVLAVVAVSCALLAVHSAQLSTGALSVPLVSLAMSSVLAHIALLTGPYRAEESAADAVAALVFGQVLTPATVARLRREEGSGARVLPAFLSTHPRPHRRRAAVLRLLDQVDHQ